MPRIVTAALRCFMRLSPDELEKREEKRKSKRRKFDDKRALAPETSETSKASEASKKLLETIRECGGIWPYRTLIMDFETTSGALSGQKIRVGYAQLRGVRYDNDQDPADDTIIGHAERGTLSLDVVDRLTPHWLIYDPDNLSTAEQQTASSFVQRFNQLSLRHASAPSRFSSLPSGKKRPEKGLASIPKLELITRNDFLKVLLNKSFASWGKRIRDPVQIVVHNGSFDFGALSRDNAMSRGKTYGGHSMKLCNCPRSTIRERETCDRKHGRFVIKKIGPKKFFYRRSEFFVDETPGATVEEKEQPFGVVDTMTLAGAGIASGTAGSRSLRDLSVKLNLSRRKSTGVSHNEQLTWKYLAYCLHDVSVTAELYRVLRAKTAEHHISRPMTKLFSTASLYKAYMEDAGVKSFFELNPEFDHKVTGAFFEGYAGALSEVGVRNKVIEIIYTDFKSEYLLIGAMMEIEKLKLAKAVLVDATIDPETIEFFETLDVDTLFRGGFWPLLRGAAFIDPTGCTLPVRSTFGTDATTLNIAVSNILKGPPQWVSFCDLAFTILQTGRCPKILKMLRLIPSAEQQEVKAICLYGQEKYSIELMRDDLNIRGVDLRTEIRDQIAAMKKAGLSSSEWEKLNDLQTGLKEVLLAGAYGLTVECNVEESSTQSEVDVYYGGNHVRVKTSARTWNDAGEKVYSGFKAELPGRFMAPWGVFPTAGGRLLLAMVEKLAGEACMNFATRDTDSFAFTRPEGVSSIDFRKRVQHICRKFQQLSPYASGDVLEIEDVNFKLDPHKPGEVIKGEFEPLYFLGCSSKRYAFGNRVEHDGKATAIIRKVSSHGAAQLTTPPGYKPEFDHIAARLVKDEWNEANKTWSMKRDPSSLANGACAAVLLDLWKRLFELHWAEAGNIYPRLDKFIRTNPQLHYPQARQISLTTWSMYEQHGLGDNPLPNARPGMFFKELPAPVYHDKLGQRALASADERVRFKQTIIADACVSLSYNIDDYPKDAGGNPQGLYWRDTHEFPIELFENQEPCLPSSNSDDEVVEYQNKIAGKSFNPHLKSVGETLVGYFNKPNHKFANAYDRGLMKRHSVVIAGQTYRGKSTRLALDEDDDELQDEGGQHQTIIDFILWPPILQGVNLDVLSEVTEIAVSRLQEFFDGTKIARPAEGKAIAAALKIDDDGRVYADPNKRKSRVQKYLEKLHAAAQRDHGEGAERIAEDLNVSPDKIWAYLKPGMGAKISKGALRVTGAGSIPLLLLEGAISHARGTNKGEVRRDSRRAQRRTALQQERIEQAGAALERAVENVMMAAVEGKLSTEDLASLKQYKPRLIDVDHPKRDAEKQLEREKLYALRAWNAARETIPGLPPLPPVDRSILPEKDESIIKIKALDGEERDVPLASAIEHAKLWDEKNQYWRQRRADADARDAAKKQVAFREQELMKSYEAGTATEQEISEMVDLGLLEFEAAPETPAQTQDTAASSPPEGAPDDEAES